ncbi:hypothetical protein RGUI_1181 [Rhodovulum sp. P5]|nr:hypothetical protein RGUI_1181 [Rhodovulum sp. P5]
MAPRACLDCRYGCGLCPRPYQSGRVMHHKPACRWQLRLTLLHRLPIEALFPTARRQGTQ